MSNQESEHIDTIAMKGRIQEQIAEDTKDMTPDEFIAYMRQRIEQSQFADFLKDEAPPKSPVTLSAAPK
jgi:hypothetical protein